MITPEPTFEPLPRVFEAYVRSFNWGALVVGGLGGLIRHVLDPVSITQSSFLSGLLAFGIGSLVAYAVGQPIADIVGKGFLASIHLASGLISVNIVLAFIKFGKTFDFKSYFTSLLPKTKV